MKPRWLIGIVAACWGWAQTPTPTPQEILDSIQAEMHGRMDREEAVPNDVLPRPLQPTGQTVSVARLRHKVPRAAQAFYRKAQKESRAGRYQQAAVELEAALRRDPEFAEAHTLLGVEYTRLERNRDAEAALGRALELDPNSATAHYYMALVRYRFGDLAEAEQSARRAVQQAPASAWPQFFLGYLLYPHEESRPEALQHLRYAARALPEAKEFLKSFDRR